MRIAAPYYLHRPSQIVRRLVGSKPPVRLPWGALIDCDPDEAIGSALVRNGVYELAVTEVLWRLTDSRDICLDVGANVGYMTSVMAHRSGPGGLVIAFEPHPVVGARLAANCRRWPSGAVIDMRTCALSSAVGRGTLAVDDSFGSNNGTAHLGSSGSPVPLETLDNALSGNTLIGVMKVDVEGHEHAVFSGGAKTLSAGQIRDIVYEDAAGYPSPVSELLAAAEYAIFAVRQTFWGPKMAPAGEPPADNTPPNYLATRDPERARRRLRGRGWRCLR